MTSPLVDFARLRITTFTAPDGTVWLLHSDVCKLLRLRNTTEALRRLPITERKTAREVVGPSGTDRWLISLGGFYRLVLSTRRKSSEVLRVWICSQVLPALTTQGHYKIPETVAVRSQLETEASNARLSKALARTLRGLDGKTITRKV
jgi:prophage antirepressor-like protein